MTPVVRTLNLVINKGDLDCVMCSSYQIRRRMDIYRGEVLRVLRLGDLDYEDGYSEKNKGEEEKGGTMMTPSTAKTTTTLDKKKSETTTVAKKIIIRRIPGKNHVELRSWYKLCWY